MTGGTDCDGWTHNAIWSLCYGPGGSGPLLAKLQTQRQTEKLIANSPLSDGNGPCVCVHARVCVCVPVCVHVPICTYEISQHCKHLSLLTLAAQ